MIIFTWRDRWRNNSERNDNFI